MKNTMRQQTGLTLIELMIVVVVLGVTAAVAVPAFNNLLRNVWTTGRVNEFVSAFNTARSAAITRANTVTICASDDPTAANPACSNTWANGWIVFEDDDSDQTVDASETVIRVWEGLEDGITLTEANGRTSVTYGSRGAVNQAMDFDMQPIDECSGQGSRAISVTPVGRTDVQEQACP